MDKELQDVQSLLTQVSVISERYEKEVESTGENFNIFKILKMETKEVKTHSAFLAELLNPKGSHGQGDIFLKLFIEEVKEDDPIDSRFSLKHFLTKNAKTKAEKYISAITEDYSRGGSIDILIGCDTGKEIIIENKIYALDQKAQLIRYHNYNTDAPLFYLSLWQDSKPDKISTYLETQKGKQELIEGKHYKCISYENEILNWLEKCHEKAVNHALLRETLKQYIYLIKYLTGQTLNKNMENELVKLLLNNLTAFDAIRKISEDKIELALIDNELKKPLEEFAHKANFECEYEVEYKSIWVCNDFLKNHNLFIGFAFDHGFFFGFNNHKPEEQNAHKNKIIEIVQKQFDDRFEEHDEHYEGWIASQYHNDRYWNLDTYLKIKNGEMAKDLIEKLKKLFEIAKIAENTVEAYF